MSENEKMPEKGGNELFCFDENGEKQDAGFHDEILAGGVDDPDAFDELLERLGIAEAFAATYENEEDDAEDDAD